MTDTRLQTFTHQSPIGHWSVSVWRTDPRLDEIVASIWFGEGKVAYQRDRILPSGQSQLLINLGPPQYRIEPGPPEVRVPFVDVWYSGLHDGPIDTEAPHGNALLGVAFTARGTFPWLGSVRARVANNAKCEPSILELLAQDPEEFVRVTAESRLRGLRDAL